MSRSSSNGIASLMALVFFFIPLMFIIAIWTDRNLEFWLSYLKGHPVDVPFWMSFIMTLVLNGVALALNVVGEILRLLVA